MLVYWFQRSPLEPSPFQSMRSGASVWRSQAEYVFSGCPKGPVWFRLIILLRQVCFIIDVTMVRVSDGSDFWSGLFKSLNRVSEISKIAKSDTVSIEKCGGQVLLALNRYRHTPLTPGKTFGNTDFTISKKWFPHVILLYFVLMVLMRGICSTHVRL